MKEIKRDNALINYHLVGSGNTTLLFLHGSYIDQSYWNNQVDYFSQNCKVLTLDLPGHGKSGKEREEWSIKGFAEDVITVLKELNLSKVILIGHSLGADINLMVATSYPNPIIGFIAVDIFKNAATPLHPDFQEQAEVIEQQLKADFSNTNEQYARMALLSKQTPPEIMIKVVNAYRLAYQPMAIKTTPEIFEMFKIEKKLLPQLLFKLYLVNVDYMPTNEEPLKKYAGSGYELLHINGTCHFPMLENPYELNKLLEKSIRKILAETQSKK